MEFNGYTFPYNPSTFEIIYEKNYTLIPLLFKDDYLQNLGKKATIIKGEGEFFGENGFLDFEKMENIFLKDGVGNLLLPSGKEKKVAFVKLKVVGEADYNTLRYYFEFREVSGGYFDGKVGLENLVLK